MELAAMSSREPEWWWQPQEKLPSVRSPMTFCRSSLGWGCMGLALGEGEEWMSGESPVCQAEMGNPTGTETACSSWALQRTGKDLSRKEWSMSWPWDWVRVWPATETPGNMLVVTLCKDAGYFFLWFHWFGGKCRTTWTVSPLSFDRQYHVFSMWRD